MRIGVIAAGFIHWNGGLDLLQRIVESIAQSKDAEEIYIYIPDKGLNFWLRGKFRRIRAFVQGRNRSGPRIDYSELLRIAATLKVKVRRIDFGHSALLRAINRDRIQVLLPSTIALPAGFPVPWLGYIYDVQHRHLPQYFSKNDRNSRDKAFKQMLDTAPHIVVNARTVKSDLICYFGASGNRITALPFAPVIPLDHLVEPSAPERPKYFLVCNQFWVHKNHKIIFQALAEIVKVEPTVHIICTGLEYEPRFPGHVTDLRSYVARHNLNEKITFKGMIPKKEQLHLLRNARALIQPTLFEGGPAGGAGQEAIACGVELILSDIPVNREVCLNGRIHYFKPDSIDELCVLMRRLWNSDDERPSVQSLRDNQRIYRDKLGAEIINAARKIAH